MPPERKAPSGTSLTRCDRTASASTSRSWLTASASEPLNVSAAGSLPEPLDRDPAVLPRQQVAGRQLLARP